MGTPKGFSQPVFNRKALTVRTCLAFSSRGSGKSIESCYSCSLKRPQAAQLFKQAVVSHSTQQPFCHNHTSFVKMRRQTLATDNNNTAIPVPATAGRSRQSIAPGAASAAGGSKHARPSTIHGSQSHQGQAGSSSGANVYNAPATVARTGHTYGSAGGSVALGWSAARGDAGNLRSSYAPTTRYVSNNIRLASHKLTR